jgi:outer membrane protein assembly factor BamB
LGELGPPPEEQRRFRGKIILALLGLMIAGGASYAIYHVVRTLAHDEEIRRDDAAKDYASGSYANAGKKYHELAEKYGSSAHASDYRLLAELSDLRAAADRTPPDPAAALGLALTFAKKYDSQDPKVKPHRDDVSRALAAIATSFADAADASVSAAEGATSVPELIRQGRQAIDLMRTYPPKDSTQIGKLSARFDAAGNALDAAQEHRRAVAEVMKVLGGPRPDVNRAHQRAIALGVANDPTVIAALQAAEAHLQKLVAYEPINRPPQKSALAVGPPVLLLETASGPPGPPQDVVLAVARGLLYVLDSRDGRRLWACRVGLDTVDLPARVPAVGDDPELVVVATADPPALTARMARTGAIVWHQPLEAACLGRPVRDDAGRLFVPTAGPEGWVYDLDARTGLMHGRFATFQPLAGGGAFDAATRRLYVPAHGQSVFVFSYGPEGPKCEGLLPTGHAAGSLRGEPIVVSGEEGLEISRYLVLGESDGLTAMKLSAFRLFDKPTQSPERAEVHLPGWSWFPPYHDAETIALVTDAGAIGVFGIKQKGDDDPPLFPLVDSPKDDRQSGTDNRATARAQLVHASESGFWALADGVLRHWRLGLTRRGGRQLAPAWTEGKRLGSPLHAAQVSADRRTLFVVTQTDSPPSYRATAVNAETGDIVWQRPLGLTIQGDPITLGGAVVVLDQAGGLYRFDPADYPADVKDAWQAAGREIAKPVDDLVSTPFVLPSGDGQSAWSVFAQSHAGGYRLTLRRVTADGTVTGGSTSIPAVIAGTPALGPNAIVLPLADGQLCRVTLDAESPKATLGPTWRELGGRTDVRGHVVQWKGDEFLISDGGRRLMRLSWPNGAKYDLDREQSLELAHRLVGAPVRIADGEVAVADSGGVVTLIRGDKPTVARQWRTGTVTAGPWVFGNQVTVVVDRHTLVWLNPAAEAVAGKLPVPGDGIESPPRLIDGKLVVADLSGRFFAFQPSGGPIGNGYQVPAEAAPAAAVMPFGPGQLFAPLTDGTVLLLSVAELSR